MKNNFKNLLMKLCLITSCLYGDFLHAQIKSPLLFDIKLTYEVRYVGDSTDSESVHTELTRLLINDSISLFESYQSGVRDSAMYFVNDETEKNHLLSEWNQGSSVLYKILKNGDRMTTYDLLFHDPQNTRGIGFYYDETIPNWELTADTTTVNGILCQQAKTRLGGRQWTAWFTTEIPITDGPYKFSGLPGLIVQVYDKRKHWMFDLKDVESAGGYKSTLKGQLDFERLNNKEAFMTAKRKYSENALDMQELRTGIKFTAETRGVVEKRLQSLIKSYSNWIELYP